MQSTEDSSMAKVRLEDIPALCKSNCKIKNRERVEKYVNEIINGGPQRLQFISDFDLTLTKQVLPDGSLMKSSFGIFGECKTLPPNYTVNSKKLYDYYRPIEIDDSIPRADKVVLMTEWWVKSSDLLVDFPVDAAEIDSVAANYKDCLRDDSEKLFAALYRLNIPVLVFSAGFGEVVRSILKHANIFHPNVMVISNFLKYENGLVKGLQEPMIHAYNKNETVLNGTKYYDQVHSHDHVIMMGDTLSDTHMADGVPASSHVLKIGFLYDHVEKRLDQFMDTFDIVLINDQTMDVPCALIDLVEKYYKPAMTSN